MQHNVIYGTRSGVRLNPQKVKKKVALTSEKCAILKKNGLYKENQKGCKVQEADIFCTK